MNACYSCGKTEAELNAHGRQLYICERLNCINECCSEHSDTVSESDTGYDSIRCLRCFDGHRDDGDES